jgi:hypothetical protein
MNISRNAALTALVVLAGLLAGCQTMTPEERRAADQRTCMGYGFKPNTDGMAQCLLQLDLDRRADMRAFEARSAAMWNQPVILERRVIVERR